jgi:hypothetical protein
MQECNFHRCNPHLILEKLGIEKEEVNCCQRLRVTHFELNLGSEGKHTFAPHYRAQWLGKIIEVGERISTLFLPTA